MNFFEKMEKTYRPCDRIKILHTFHEMIQLLEEKGIWVDILDRYVLLFVFNAGGITDLSDKKAILKGVKLYDAFDPLNRFDTAGELFIELDLLDFDEC